jgi:hypothetical protein
MPYLDDQSSLEILIPRISAHVKEFYLLLVDDGSIQLPISQTNLQLLHPNSTVLKLKRNSGVQRALALGLLYIEDNFDYEHVVVMDSDGEDSPESVPALLQYKAQKTESDTSILVASRLSRKNSLTFKVLWRFYKLLFHLLTGKTMNFGNFSLLSRKSIQRLIHYPQIWLHLGSSYLLSGLQIDEIQLSRGFRYSGNPRMKISALVNHGLRSFVALSELIIPRVFLFSTILFSGSVLFVLFGYFFDTLWLIHISIMTFFFVCFSLLLVNLILFNSISRSSIEYHGGNYLNLIDHPQGS